MLGKYLAASAVLVLGTATAMTAQANYYAQPMMQQPMMAQPMMQQPMMAQPMMQQPMMAQPMMAQAPAPVVAPTIVVNNANTQQQANQTNQTNQRGQRGQGGVNGPLSIDLALQRCALGGMLVGNTNPSMASSINFTSGSTTSATTSGLSSPESCVTPIYAAAAFIRDSMSELEADLTLGRGEHLTALNSIMSCNTASKNLRLEYATFTKTTAYSVSSNADKANQLFQIVDRNLSSSACSA